MYELTAGQTQAVGGGAPRVPYHYKSQRLIVPPWPESEEQLEPPNYEPPSKDMPQF